MAGATLSQGQAHILWQARHFRKVKYRPRGVRITFARSCANSWQAQHFQGYVQIVWQARPFTRSSADVMAGAELLQDKKKIDREDRRNIRNR